MKLPARLEDFEQYLYWDDYPAYPNTIGCRVRLAGEIRETALKSAVAKVHEMHPLLGTRVKMTRRGPVWSHLASSPKAFRISDRFLREPFTKRIDLVSEDGGQLHWAADENTAVLSFLLHHAAADGIGGLQIVTDWLVAYANELSRLEPDRFPRIKIRRVLRDRLDSRGDFGFWRWRFLKKLPQQAIGLLGVWEFLRNRPVKLKPEKTVAVDQNIPDPFPGLITADIGDAEQFRRVAKQENVTANDLILQYVFAATARLRNEMGWGSDHDLLRIMVPVNLRTIRDRYLPAANRASLVSLDRKQADCRVGKPLKESIRLQMDVIQKNELGYTFLHILRFLKWMPGGLRRIARPDRVASTVLVTNLGEPFRRIGLPKNDSGKAVAGDLILDAFDLLAPLRPNTHAAFAVYRYAGRLFLSLTYDNRVITADQSNLLLGFLRNEIAAHRKIVLREADS